MAKSCRNFLRVRRASDVFTIVWTMSNSSNGSSWLVIKQERKGRKGARQELKQEAYPTAVDGYRRAGDVSGALRNEERSHGGELFRPAEPPHRYFRFPTRSDLGRVNTVLSRQAASKFLD